MIIDKLTSIENQIQLKLKEVGGLICKPTIVAVSKTFPISHVTPLINHGHLHFGENKVQEALEKWSIIKNDYKQINLHMIGKLQTNKVKHAIELFDYIHSLDSRKLAEKISNEQQKKGKKLKIFIQVNIGDERQKNGIPSKDIFKFHDVCVNELNLNIVGLMCIPPKSTNPNFFFEEMKKIKDSIDLQELSMGMSDDYLKAIECGSTFLRIGSKIFGERD